MDKVRFIEALAETGLREIECVSFVNPKKVPSMADAEAVAAGIRRKEGVKYIGLWLNLRGLDRAVAAGMDLKGRLASSTSPTFSLKNSGADLEREIERQREWVRRYRELGIEGLRLSVMTAFGCNMEGDIEPRRVVEVIERSFAAIAEEGAEPSGVSLADTVGWATPWAVERVWARCGIAGRSCR